MIKSIQCTTPTCPWLAMTEDHTDWHDKTCPMCGSASLEVIPHDERRIKLMLQNAMGSLMEGVAQLSYIAVVMNDYEMLDKLSEILIDTLEKASESGKVVKFTPEGTERITAKDHTEMVKRLYAEGNASGMDPHEGITTSILDAETLEEDAGH